MTAATKAKPSVYVTGLCSTGRCGDCRGVYAGTVCTCVCHSLEPPALMEVAAGEVAGRQAGDSVPLAVAPIARQGDVPAELDQGDSTLPHVVPDLDLGDALLALHNGVEGIDLATVTFDGNDIELCDLLGQVRADRVRLAQVESVLEQRAAKAMTGDLLTWPGGTAERHRGKDRREWDHATLVREVRDAVIRPLAVDTATGEVDSERVLVLSHALDAYASTNRPTWRVTALRDIGLNADDFCHAVPGRSTVQVTLAGGAA